MCVILIKRRVDLAEQSEAHGFGHRKIVVGKPAEANPLGRGPLKLARYIHCSNVVAARDVRARGKLTVFHRHDVSCIELCVELTFAKGEVLTNSEVEREVGPLLLLQSVVVVVL